MVTFGAKRNRKGAKVELIPLSFRSGLSGVVRRNPDENLTKVCFNINILLSYRWMVYFRNRNVLGRQFRGKNVSGVPSKLLP